jgi:hypothetical protein
MLMGGSSPLLLLSVEMRNDVNADCIKAGTDRIAKSRRDVVAYISSGNESQVSYDFSADEPFTIEEERCDRPSYSLRSVYFSV